MTVTCDGHALLANVHVGGVPRSTDGGNTWQIERDGLHAHYCSAVAFVGDDVLVAASTDHFTAEGALYRRALGRPGLTPLCGTGGLPR